MGLVGRYPTNYLIDRRLILEHEFVPNGFPDRLVYQGLPTVSRGYPRLEGRLSTCY